MVFIRRLWRGLWSVSIAALLLSSWVQPALAATGTVQLINFQGKVVNKTVGTNIADGSYNFVFNIYSVSTGGAAIWTESKSVTVTNGIFQTLLGDTTSLPGSVDFNTDNLYLGINFNSDGEMLPRVRFTAVPQALNAQKVAGLNVTNTTGTLTIPSGKTISFSDAFTTSGAFPLTLTTSASTNVTLPTTGTLSTLANTEELTNKTIGSTGLIFSAATTDIDAASGEALVIQGRAASTIQTTAGTITLQSAGSGTISTVQIGVGGAGSTTPDYLGLDVKSDTGDPAGGFEGAMYYNTADNKFRCYENTAWANCITPAGGSPLFSSFLAATGPNSINNGDNAQTWNWRLTTASQIGLKLAENIASTATTNASILSVETLSGSSANAIMIRNFGDGLSFRIEDVSADTTPFVVDATGNVGIKNNTPLESLDVGGNASVSGNLTLYGAQRTIAARSKQGLVFGDAETGNIIFSSTAGNIGIATTTPAERLDIAGNATLSGKITFGGTSATNLIAAQNKAGLTFGDTNTGNIYFTQSGNIGVGLTTGALTPEKLTVSGNASVSGNLTLYGANATLAARNKAGLTFGDTETGNIYFNPNGNIGIGLASGALTPEKLTISGNATLSGKITFGGTSGTNIIAAQNKAGLTFGDTNTGNIYFTQSGNIGVGLTSGALTPEKLTVSGSATISGNLTFSGATTTIAARNAEDITLGDSQTGDILLTQAGNVAIGTTDASKAKLYVSNGNIRIGERPNSTATEQMAWSRISDSAAGTIASGGTASIASISAQVVYNGSLYVGTSKSNAAEVYRYDGGTSWTKVSQSTAGTIAASGTANIDTVRAMTVYAGNLYIGTVESNAAEVYRYDGGTSWTKVTQAAGTIAAAGTANIDGVRSFGVYRGILYLGTEDVNGAQLYRYGGGTTWTLINTTIGLFVTTNSTGMQKVTAIQEYNGNMYIAVSRGTVADLLRYNGSTGASVFTKMNNNTSGSFGGVALTNVDEISSLAVHAGRLYLGVTEPNAMNVLFYDNNALDTVVNLYQRVNSASGTMRSGGTANIDGVQLITYNGSLYAGTWENNSAEVYRYDNKIGFWTRVSSGVAGTVAPAGTTAIDKIATLQGLNNRLYLGTEEPSSAQMYSIYTSLDESYALEFESSIAGNQTGWDNIAQISFSASASTSLASAVNGRIGSFLFSHSILTNFGAYDVAEDYPTRDSSIEPGDIVAIDLREKGMVRKSSVPYDRTLVGVYSERPGLRLSQQDQTIDGATAIPIALVGRVPVKVSTENGAIEPGDNLTSSSIPGVAMKATKAGMVLGRAMEKFEGPGLGKVLTFVNMSSYTGKDELAGLEHIENENGGTDLQWMVGEDVLRSILNSESPSSYSVVATDRLVATKEVIAPKIIADLIEAKTIRADSIQGIEVLTNSIRSLQQQLDASSSGIIASNSLSNLPLQGNLPLQFGRSVFNLDVDVLGNLTSNGGLVVLKQAEFKGPVFLRDIVEFFGLTKFHQDTVFEGNPLFNQNTVGSVAIAKDVQETEVAFSKAFSTVPALSVTMAVEPNQNQDDAQTASTMILNGELRYVVMQTTANGFILRLNRPAPAALRFTWTSFVVSGTPQPQVTAIPSPSATPEPTNTPSPTPEPVLPSPTPSEVINTPTPTPIPTTSPSPTPEETATPLPTPAVQ